MIDMSVALVMHIPYMKISQVRTPTVHDSKKLHPFTTHPVSKS
jgi:hypothetical protein